MRKRKKKKIFNFFQDLLDRAENRERKLKMQEDLERARQRRLEWEMQQTQNQMKMHQQMGHNEEWKRQQQSLEVILFYKLFFLYSSLC